MVVDHKTKTNSKRKKFHDKDKYYRLAKEQGLRSRAAFKLVQINRKFGILENADAVLDLCAAPGGWTQIAARTCKASNIIAVDILPIRKMPNSNNNVTTLVGDITTDKTKSDIQRILKQQSSQTITKNKVQFKVDVVLHDGAPNIGAEYNKDAYVQNELALHALKLACSHLKPGGTFVTKMYRSRDYLKYQYVVNQLFDNVQAFKPNASRQQSAEIFFICQNYMSPIKIDPKLLDPKHVFDTIDDVGGGSDVIGAGGATISILDKNWDKKKKKNRSGYDHDFFDATMRHVESVHEFVLANFKTAIRILSTSTGLEFNTNGQKKCCCSGSHGSSSRNEEDEEDEEDNDDENNNENKPCDICDFLLHHPFTTNEIKESLADLQLLNKTDFKRLLQWRTQMQQALEARSDQQQPQPPGTTDGGRDAEEGSSSSDDDEEEEEDEGEIQAEIAQMRQLRQKERKRKKKKERAKAAKRRKQAALGMNLNAIDIHDDQIFSLSTITSPHALQVASEVNLDEVTDEQIFGADGDDDELVVVGGENGKDLDDDDVDARKERRAHDLDRAYEDYLQQTKDGLAKAGTKMAKRSKKLERMQVAQEVEEDVAMAAANVSQNDAAQTYAKLLQGASDDSNDDKDSSSDDDDDDDDGFYAKPMTPAEHAVAAAANKGKGGGNPLIHKFADEPANVKTARWFSNPLFASIGKYASAAQKDTNKEEDSDDFSDDEGKDDDDLSADDKPSSKKISAEDVLAAMPKTDKQKRHEKRLKQMERDERKKSRRAKKLGDLEGDFQVVARGAKDDNDGSDQEEADRKLEHLSDSQRQKVLEARELIKAGLGHMDDDDDHKNGKKIEIVASSEERPLPIMDDRKYDSDHEDYDSDDYAQTLALGTMMLRRSKEKAFVDASYNRYAWNDPKDLPEWFVDDESKHYRPQLPIPPALLAKMKEKMMALSTKPIAKVAEARARKSKRAKLKLAAAKKKAEAVANSSDMTEAMKLKAISKALRGQETRRPGKTYVVAKKGRGNKGVKGAKSVDKRMKSDKRAMERKDKKRKKGKQNSLVGSKKRRHHS